MGAVRLFARVRADLSRADWGARPMWVPWARRRDARHGASALLRGLPDDVRGHHAGAHLRCVRRAHEVQRLHLVHPGSGRHSFTTRLPTGCGATGAGSTYWRSRLCGRDGRCIWTAGRQRAGVRARDRQARGLPEASRVPSRPHDDAHRAPGSSGSAGSASTPGARSRAVRWRRSAFIDLRSLAPQAGRWLWSPSGGTGTDRRRSASLRGWSPGWWPSHLRPDTSPRGLPS